MFLTVALLWCLGVFVVVLGVRNRPSNAKRAFPAVPRALTDAARRTGGRVVRTLSQVPVLRFRWDGIDANLRSYPGGSLAPPHTRIHFAWRPPAPMWLEPERGPHRRTPARARVRDIRIGDRDFDRMFLIHGPSEEWIRTALDEHARLALLNLARHHRDAEWVTSLNLQGGASGVSLQVADDLVAEGPAALRLFLEHAMVVLEVFRTRSSAGLEVVTREEVVSCGTCPVCGDPITEPVSQCTDCRTPHHADCWEYFGGCAIYACDGDAVLAAEGDRPRDPDGEARAASASTS